MGKSRMITNSGMGRGRTGSSGLQDIIASVCDSQFADRASDPAHGFLSSLLEQRSA
jgi:hypothetical protein